MSELASVSTGKESKTFNGFASLDANFIYCPNQFLDLCLKHCTRSEVRAIAFVLVETLQFRDENGEPTRQDIVVAYEDFSSRAGMSPRSVKEALEGALKKGFLTCKQRPRPKRKGQPAQSGIYSLSWDYSDDYSTDLSGFDGFFAGEGRRSPLPVEFFRQIIPQATLSAIRVTGTVLRHTLGYQAQFGRRQQAQLSYDSIQAHSGIKDRKDVTRGIEESIRSNFITLISAGLFHKDADKRTPSVYGPKWLAAVDKGIFEAKNPPAALSKKPTSFSKQKTHQQGGKKPTINEAESPPAKSGKKPTTRKKTSKHTNKQQLVVARLEEEGISSTAIEKMLKEIEIEQIQQQLDWIEFRDATSNRQGMLRDAIFGNWSKPKRVIELEADMTSKATDESKQAELDNLDQSNHEAGVASREKREQKLQRHRELSAQWCTAPESLRYQAAENVFKRTTDPDELEALNKLSLENPNNAMLKELSTLLQAEPATV